MRNVIIILVFIFLSFSGCSPSGTGSGVINQGVTVWGSGEDGLEFVLFTDMDGSTSAESGNTKSGILTSQKAGSTEPDSGTRINWSADLTSIKISGHEYSFAKGRVFLIAANGRSLEIQQIDLLINKTGASHGEVQRLSMFPQVKNFFAKKSDNISFN